MKALGHPSRKPLHINMCFPDLKKSAKQLPSMMEGSCFADRSYLVFLFFGITATKTAPQNIPAEASIRGNAESPVWAGF